MFQGCIYRIFQKLPSTNKLIRKSIPILGPKTYCTASGNFKNGQTIQTLKEELRTVMGVDIRYKKHDTDRDKLNQILPANASELPSRTMADSFISAIIPLEVDIQLQDRYISFLGRVRKGRLLEDMDILAVMVLQKYILNPKVAKGAVTPYTLITVQVDQVFFFDNKVQIDANIIISGYVSWVGTSSAEIVVWLEQKIGNETHKIVQAIFIIIARNATNTGPTFLNPLKVEEGPQTAIFKAGVSRNERRMKMRTDVLSHMLPTPEEQAIMHNLFVNTLKSNELDYHKRNLPADSLWMNQCTLSTVHFCHPEDRNFHNTVFGGLILKNAYELAHSLTYLFIEETPKIISMSDVTFKAAVPVHSLLKMRASIVYTHGEYVQVTNIAECIDQGSNMVDTTDKFHFTFKTRSGKAVKKIVPNTYVEAIMYIDGYRHFNNTMNENHEIIPLINPVTK